MIPTTTQFTWNLVSDERRAREMAAAYWRLGRHVRTRRRVA
jgi:hypothetical protein